MPIVNKMIALQTLAQRSFLYAKYVMPVLLESVTLPETGILFILPHGQGSRMVRLFNCNVSPCFDRAKLLLRLAEEMKMVLLLGCISSVQLKTSQN